MKLALRELNYYKLKYLLITSILFLLAFLVLFVTSLAQGLARDNISMINHFNASRYIISKEADHQLTQSSLSDKDTTLLESHHIPLISVQQLPLKNNLTVTALYMEKPDVKVLKGRLPKNKGETAVDHSLMTKVKIGDILALKNQSIHYKVTGFIDDQMYAHTPVALMTKNGFKQFNPQLSKTLGLINVKENWTHQLKDSEVITSQQLMKGIASYEAEQMPLNLMVIFLFLISAIVISTFFYVITIQKTNEYGILKAIGIKNSRIASSILAEVLIVTSIGSGIAIALTISLSKVIPVTMPFHLNKSLIILLAGLFFIVGFIGALMSLIKVIRIDPQVALGGE